MLAHDHSVTEVTITYAHISCIYPATIITLFCFCNFDRPILLVGKHSTSKQTLSTDSKLSHYDYV